MDDVGGIAYRGGYTIFRGATVVIIGKVFAILRPIGILQRLA